MSLLLLFASTVVHLPPPTTPYDFPNSPSVGQQTTGYYGQVYVWDGAKWTRPALTG